MWEGTGRAARGVGGDGVDLGAVLESRVGEEMGWGLQRGDGGQQRRAGTKVDEGYTGVCLVRWGCMEGLQWGAGGCSGVCMGRQGAYGC